MSAFPGAVNTTISGGHLTVVSNTVTNAGAQNDIISVLLSHSATAGLLDAAERFDAPKCDDGTRVSMLRGMKNFVQEGGPSSRPAMYWLHGPAGVGKSALAQSLALLLKDEGDHAASFFFSRTAPGRNDGNRLIVTLACQLALSIPLIKPLLAEAVKENPLIFIATNAIKMQSLIVGPINKLHKMSRWNLRLLAQRVAKRKLHPRLILVDGLDECNDPQVQRDLLLCIGLATRQLLLPFRFVIASRPESHILATFELDRVFQSPDAARVLMKNLGDDEDADEQVTTFLLKQFAEIRRTHPIRDFLPQRWPLPGQIAQLVSKSSKGFIYPATVIRYIKMPNNRPDECLERILGLSEIPIGDRPYEPLDGLYLYIFDSVPHVNKEAVRNIFHFLVIPSGLDDFISTRLIEEYFDYKPGHVHHVLCDLLCIVALTHNGLIKVLHASLADFLLDRSRSGHLCIDIADVHVTIGASFPLALSNINTSRLPDFHFVGFLEHIMQANMTNMLLQGRLANVDFESRYVRICESGECSPSIKRTAVVVWGEKHLEGIAFLAAYLLLLVIKNVPQTYVRTHIEKLKAYVLQEYPFATSLHAVRNELLPAMIPLFRKWTLSSTINHQYINYIFAFEVPPSQCELREEIFELYLLMIVPFFVDHPRDKDYPQDTCHQPQIQRSTILSNLISDVLLRFLLWYNGWNTSVDGLKLLATELLGVSLAQAGYSTSLTTHLADLSRKLLHTNQSLERDIRKSLPKLAPQVIGYFDRVYLEASAESQEEFLALNHAWKQYIQDTCKLDT